MSFIYLSGEGFLSEQQIINKEGWQSIQEYTRMGVSLPANQEEFCRIYGQDLSYNNFLNEICCEYQNIHHECDGWINKVMPELVNLAKAISSYGKDLTTQWLPTLKDYIAEARDVPEKKRSACIELIRYLFHKMRNEAAHVAEQANMAYRMSDIFVNMTKQRLNNLTRNDGGGLLDRMEKEYGDFGKLQQMHNEVEAHAQRVREAEARYNARKKILIWIPFAGLALISDIKKLNEEINSLNADYDRFNRMNRMYCTIADVSNVLRHCLVNMRRSIPAVQVISNLWHMMSDDCASIAEEIHYDGDTLLVKGRKLNLQIDVWIENWKSVVETSEFFLALLSHSGRNNEFRCIDIR